MKDLLRIGAALLHTLAKGERIHAARQQCEADLDQELQYGIERGLSESQIATMREQILNEIQRRVNDWERQIPVVSVDWSGVKIEPDDTLSFDVSIQINSAPFTVVTGREEGEPNAG